MNETWKGERKRMFYIIYCDRNGPIGGAQLWKLSQSLCGPCNVGIREELAVQEMYGVWSAVSAFWEENKVGVSWM